jgi:hypothetical protein
VLQNLVNNQRYSLDEVDFALAWVVKNLETKLGGRVQSLGILPHVIGEALLEKAARERKRAKARARAEEDHRVGERENLHRRVEEILDTLSPDEHEQCILPASAVDFRIPPPFPGAGR